MPMVDVDDSCQFSADSQLMQVDWLGLRVGGHPALSLHSSDEPGGYYYCYTYSVVYQYVRVSPLVTSVSPDAKTDEPLEMLLTVWILPCRGAQAMYCGRADPHGNGHFWGSYLDMPIFDALNLIS